MPTTLSNCCTQCKQYRDEVGVNGVWVSCANTLCECHVTPHQEGEEKCKRCGLLKSTVDAANIVCFSEEFHGVDISVTHDFSPNPHQEGGGRNLRDNKDGSCNCKPLGSSCFFTNWWTGGPCDCPCHTTQPTTKQGEDEFTQNTFRGATNLLYPTTPPTTQSWKGEFVKDFCVEVPYRDTDLLYWRGFEEKNINLIPTPKTVIEWIEETLATALKEQEERLEKTLREFKEETAHLDNYADCIDGIITLIKSTK